MISMYKNLLGWVEHKADDKHHSTHVLMTNEEYHEMLQEKSELLQERNEIINDANRKIKKAQKIIDEKNETMRRMKLVYEEEFEKIKKELTELRRLNNNLVRINKERSNAERKLQPKKQHTGYVVVSSQEKEIRYDIRNQKSYIAWETVIQTPYTVEMNENDVRMQIDSDMTPNGARWLLGDIGINMVYYAELAKILKDEECDGENVIFSRKLKANYTMDFWEISYMHTKALTTVPKDMRRK